jgi:hypothetical protein
MNVEELKGWLNLEASAYENLAEEMLREYNDDDACRMYLAKAEAYREVLSKIVFHWLVSLH